jgi:pSer/pThr/pTyr-binding forkhead associated (FHA) protein
MKLIIEDDEGRRTVIPVVRDELTIGRNETNMVRLMEKNVSRRHARLIKEDGHFFIEDLNSFTGVRVNGEKVQGKRVVHEGDLIQISEYDLSLQASPEEKREGLGGENGKPARAAEEIAAPAKDATVAAAELKARREAETAVIRLSDLPRGEDGEGPTIDVPEERRPKLVGISGSYRGKELVLDRTPIRLGRSEENDIELDHPSISRTHCRLHLDNGTWKVMDAWSSNGVRVNGEPYAAIGLRHGDVLEIGHLRFAFVQPGQPFKLPSEFALMSGPPEPARRGLALLVAGCVAFVGLLAGGVWYFARPRADEGVEVVPDSVHERKFALRAADAALAAHHYGEALRHLEVARRAGATAAELRNYNQVVAEARSEDLYGAMESAAAAQDFEKARKLLGELSSTSTYHGRKAAEKAEAITAGYVNLHVAAAALAKGKDNAACLSEAQLALQANPQSRDAQSLVQACKAPPPSPVRSAVRVAAPAKPSAKPIAVASAGRASSPARDGEALKLFDEGNRKLQGPPADPAAAVAVYQKALSLRPSQALLGRIYRALGIAYARQGNLDAGAHYYKLYLPFAAPEERAQLQKYLEQFEARRK